MYILVTYKFKMDWINSNQQKVLASIFRRSRAVNSVSSGQVWPKFVLILACMHVLITCMYEKDPMKKTTTIKRGYTVLPILSLIRFFFFRSVAANSVVCGQILSNFEFIQALRLMYVIAVAANSVVCGQILSNFEFIQALMYVIATCKYEKDLIKNSRENVTSPFTLLLPYGSYLLPLEPEF